MVVRGKTLRAFAILCALGFSSLGLQMVWTEPRDLVVREVELRLPRWPRGYPPLRVAVASDLHIGSPHNGLGRLAELVRRINATRPDAVVLLGDFSPDVLGGRKIAPERWARILTGLRAREGVYAVLGNHDWYFDGPRIRAALETYGKVEVLEDASTAARRGRFPVWLAGISDFVEAEHDVAKALADVPTKVPVVAITHNPDVFPTIPPRVALTLAGHTHGGQIRLPVLGALHTASRYGQRYTKGHVTEGGRHLFVTSGVGLSALPLRLGTPPEIVILRLRAAGA